MTRTRFHQGLDQLKEKLLVMGGLAEQSVDMAVDGYRRRDAKLCNQVFEIEKQINLAEREIDELALDLLAMQQPMAVDLRFIMACMKINADLERVGDQAVNIAQRGIEVSTLADADLHIDIPRMAETVAGMMQRALESFIERKADLAEAVLKMDDVVDRMNDDIFVAMAEKIRSSPEASLQALDALLVSRNLERVADHATNIAEDVIFWVRGADVRHGGGKDKTDPEND
ncbi:MAG TPA: phosphate signaling complex protein PhoU [Terriglobales bacterium]|nr:phosphate signaling complex protein PhoU [Terriglobales bacterium]